MNLWAYRCCLNVWGHSWSLSLSSKEDGEEQTERKQLLHELQAFLTMPTCILLNSRFQRNWRVKTWNPEVIHAWNTLLCTNLSMHFISWQRGRSFINCELMYKELGFANWLLMLGRAAGLMLRGWGGLSVCAPGWMKAFPSTSLFCPANDLSPGLRDQHPLEWEVI